MAQPKNTLARVLVPLVAIALGLGVVASVIYNSNHQTVPTPVSLGPTGPTGASGTTGTNRPTASTGAPPPTGAPVPTGTAAATQTAPAPTGGLSLDGLHAKSYAGETGSKGFAPIGSLTPGGPLVAEIRFSTLGAGVRSIALADFFQTIQDQQHEIVQQEHVYFAPATPENPNPAPDVLTPLAAISAEIDGQSVGLLGAYEDPGTGATAGTPVWLQTAPGVFEAEILNGANQRVARLERRYELVPGSFVVRVKQKAENFAGREVRLKWTQFGPIDLRQDSAYAGDKRRVRFGYLLDPARQTPADPTVSATEFVWPRTTALGSKTGQFYELVRDIWPNDVSARNGLRPVWLGETNRYFAAAMHPLVPPGAGPDQKVFALAAKVERVLSQQYTLQNGQWVYDPLMVLKTTSSEFRIPAGGSADLSHGFYAGPLAGKTVENDPVASASGLGGLIVYNFGGMCGFCTFSFLTSTLLAVLHGLHFLVQDWGLSIMLLVCCVRLVLHPVTKWSQIRMQRFGKQMQGMAPKQKKIQEKFGSDPQKLREEMARLWREEGVSPTGMLGCIPMFLQTPVWIALYATLFFAFDLRQQPAFYGVFQHIQPSTWPTWWFLGDLAEPDRLLYIGHPLFTIPFVNWPVQSINVLPVVLAVVFFIQQKYLTPPPTPGSMTPEQQQQQKIMKWMMVFMFPLLMYNAPCGLTLYFIMNSTLGILESRYIRSHIAQYEKEREARGGSEKKPGGFLARLQAMAEERQKQMLKGRGMQPPPRKRV